MLITTPLCVKLPEWREGLGGRSWADQCVGEGAVKGLMPKRGLRGDLEACGTKEK